MRSSGVEMGADLLVFGIIGTTLGARDKAESVRKLRPKALKKTQKVIRNVHENSDQKTQKVVSDVIKTVILMKDSDFDKPRKTAT